MIGAALVASACTDLTETPYTEVTDENFKPTEGDIGSLMAPAYTPLRNVWMGWYGNLDTQEESSDVLITPVRPNGWYDGGTYVRMHQHRWNASQGQPSSLYNNSFSGINAANRVIFQLESGAVPVAEPLKTQVLTELRAVRAYYYYLLLDSFGNVPIVTDFTSTELPVQSTRKEVYDFVVSELTATIPGLSDKVGAPIYGRINRYAAQALLARVYLNAGVYTGTPQYAKVLELTQQVIDANKYSLEAKYRTSFSRTNHTSNEIVWGVPYDAIYATESSFHMKTLKPELQFVFNMQGAPWGGSASNPQFIETYDPADQRLKDSWLIGPQYDSQGRGYNFVKDVPSIDGNPTLPANKFDNGYPVWKYEIYAGQTGSSDVDYPIIRYAEVLMMRAEALLRTGDAAGAATLVTQVRQRNFADGAKATVTAADLVKGSSYNYGWYQNEQVWTGPDATTPVVDGGADIQYGRFLDELGWEFAVEGHRRRDLIRFGVFTTKSWFNHQSDGGNQNLILFPIPQGVLNSNMNLKQNPGY
jgi:hypothetical protein